MSAHNLTRDYQSPITPRFDDEEDDERDETPKPTVTPVGALIQKKFLEQRKIFLWVGSSRVDLQACKLEYSIVSPK